MKILLVQQDQGRRATKPIFPIGLSYIATALHDYQVRIFDPNVYDFPESFKKLEEEISAFQPDVVGISIRDIDTTYRRDIFITFKTIYPTIDIIKKITPQAKIVVGGAGFSMFGREIMERVSQIDFGILLEGEESIRELLENLQSPEEVKGIFFRQNGEVHFTGKRPLPDFNALPLPKKDIDGLNIDAYGCRQNGIGIQAKRGCAFKCAYCAYPFLNGTQYRLRDPAKIVDEIEELISRYGIKQFSFVDSIFNVPQKHAQDICHEIIKRKLDVQWEAWFDLKNFSYDIMALARKAGCVHVGFSPDACNNEGLVALKKGITEENIANSITIARKFKDVSFGYSLFCAYPGQNALGLLKTIFFLFKLAIFLPGRVGGMFGWIRIEPNTEIHRIAVNEKLIDKDTDLLAEDVKELDKLFYDPPSLWYVGLIMNPLFWLKDCILAPVKAIRSFRNKKKGNDPAASRMTSK